MRMLTWKSERNAVKNEVDTRSAVGRILVVERSPDRAGAARSAAAVGTAGFLHVGCIAGDGARLLADRAGMVASRFPAPHAGTNEKIHHVASRRFLRRSCNRRRDEPGLD